MVTTRALAGVQGNIKRSLSGGGYPINFFGNLKGIFLPMCPGVIGTRRCLERLQIESMHQMEILPDIRRLEIEVC